MWQNFSGYTVVFCNFESFWNLGHGYPKWYRPGVKIPVSITKEPNEQTSLVTAVPQKAQLKNINEKFDPRSPSPLKL